MAIPPLHHGIIGNGRVLALVAPDSGIEWLCMPRFDSPTVFGSLLDTQKGGVFRIRGAQGPVTGRMIYLTNTNVLRTEFTQGEDRWEVIDFAPRLPRWWSVDCPLEVVRLVRPIAGRPRLSVEFDPRPDYGRLRPTFVPGAHGIELTGGDPFYLATNLADDYVLNGQEFSLSRPLFFAFGYGRLPEARPPERFVHDLDLTITGWRQWARSCALPPFASAAALRSALCLKLHIYQETGAIIAAATTSIPEAFGTERTWDYRYCWLRDAAFVVDALRRMSHLNEGERFIEYLRDVAESGPLQPVYGIGGERDLPERMLPYLAGFGGNGFVRVGNAAAEQRQHDLMGEIVLCLETLLTDPRLILDDQQDYWPLIERMVEQAIRLAPVPDTGIWEFRSNLKPHTFSRSMCQVAALRGSRLAKLLGRPQHAERWAAIAAAEREEILRRGYNEKLGYFTQAIDGQHPDASNLLLPTLGIVDPRDPRFLSTLDAYAEKLVDRGLMLRYRLPDDFGETTSAFTICSFWWAEALALAGRMDEAEAVFERVLSYANPLGLFSEDIDPTTGAMLGNFPQAYTHVGLIQAAMTIGELRDARDGRVRSWA